MVDVYERVSAAWAVGEELRTALGVDSTVDALNEYAAFWGISINSYFSLVFIGLHQLHDPSDCVLSIPNVLAGDFGPPPANLKADVEKLLAPRKGMLGKIAKVRHKLLAHLAPDVTWDELFKKLGIPRAQVSLCIVETGEVLQRMRASNENAYGDLGDDQAGSDARRLIEAIRGMHR